MVFETAHSSFTRLLSALTLILLGSLLLAASARGQDRYVATTGDDTANDCATEATPCLTITHALGEAVDGDAIHIADGEYTESVNIDKDIMLDGTSEVGTIIQAHANPGEADSRVITIDGGFEVEITNLTIRHGNATGADPNDQGGGLYNNGATLSVANVTFSENTAAAGGGMAADASSITVENGSFTENTAVDGAGGGAIYAIESDVTLNGVLVDSNHAEGVFTNTGDGGGIHVQDGTLTLNNNTTVSNNTTAGLASEGGGIWMDSGAQLFMTDSQCTGNQTGPEDLSRGGCAFVDDATNVDISGSTITGNETTAVTNGPGGGLAILGNAASVVITNTELSDNSTAGTDADGGGMWLTGSELTVDIIGSTISGNSTDGPDGSGGGMLMQSDGSQGTVTIENTEFTANSTAAGDSPAGALRVAGIDGTVTIANSTFSNNSTAGFSSWGGAFVAAAVNELNITDTEFTGNSTADVASGGGAMAFNAEATPVINLTNVTCNDNHTGNVDLPLEGLTNAGCLGINNAIANDATEVNIAGSSFTNNSVTGSSDEAGQWGGGAIVMNGDDLTFTITNTTIDGNATEGANGEGGGIWLAGGMTGEIIGSTISGNSTDGPGSPGGGIWMQGGGSQGTLTIEDTEFTGNTAAAGGGMAADASSITVENGSFTENTAVDGAGGGAIYAIESDVTLNSVLVDNNHAEGGTSDSGDGGGIHVQTGNLTLNNSSTVSNNTTAGDASEGGGIWVDSGQLVMTDSQCTGNGTGPEDLSRGGCAFVDDATGVDISGSTITGNETTAVTNGSGGGLAILALAGSVAPVVIADTEFADNRTVGTDAPGGAIVMRGDNLTFAITNTTIDGNATEGANGEGGGIWLADGATGTIVGSTLSNNSAENGGGMANLSDGTSELYGTTFTGNEAGDLGGGLYNEGDLTVTHSTVSGNGGTNGAGLFNDGALTLMNSTVSGNVATGNGGGLNNFGTLTVVHSTVSGNAVAGGGGSLFNNGTATFTNSLAVNSTANCEGGGTLDTEGVNFDDDGSCAGFTNDPDAGGLLGPLADNRGLTETHALLEGNPALEAAGDCVNEFGITDDQRGAPRPQGTACDAGAFEFANDLDAASVAGWRLIAPPGDGLTVQDLAGLNLVQGVTGSYPGTDFPNVFRLYDGPTEEDYTAFTSVEDPLEPGRGIWWYLYDDSDFSGTPPPEFVDIEDFSFPIIGTALEEATQIAFDDVPVLGVENPVPAYMIGNPFPAAFQLAGVSTDVAGLQTNFFAWEPNEGAGTYQALDQADYVSPWQGLMSEVDNEDEAPTYSFDFGSVNEEEFPPIIGLRASTSFALNLKLQGALEGGQPVVDLANRLRFEADAMAGWDRHDGSKFMPPLTTPVRALLSPEGLRDGQPYRQSVRSLPGALEEDITVPVAFLASGSGSFEISAEPENLPEGWDFTLRDLETDEETNLLEESYTFDAGATEDWEDRFEVTVTPAGVVGTEGDGPAELHLSNPAPNPASGSTALVLQVPEAQHVAAHVYDTLGRLVSTVHDGDLTAGEEVRLEIETSTLAASAYVVRVKGETFAETRRFTVVR